MAGGALMGMGNNLGKYLHPKRAGAMMDASEEPEAADNPKEEAADGVGSAYGRLKRAAKMKPRTPAEQKALDAKRDEDLKTNASRATLLGGRG
jgi:hypothetical protein